MSCFSSLLVHGCISIGDLPALRFDAAVLTVVILSSMDILVIGGWGGVTAVAYPELLRYQGTHTLNYRFCAILLFNSSQNYIYAWLLRIFARTQTNSTRASALVGPGVAMPLCYSTGESEYYLHRNIKILLMNEHN